MRRRRAARGIAASGCAAAVAMLIVASANTSAQTETWSAPYPMLLTPNRALAIVTAADRGLNYVPGEVVVRFRAGVTDAGQQRALMSLRSRPAASDLRWIGDAAVLVDPTEPDATVLAAQLRRQPAIVYAVGKGAFVAIAMGNSYEDGNPIEYPAADAAELDGVMSVGALGPSLKRSFYSNTGPHLEISAPGGDDREGGARSMIWQSTIARSDSVPITVITPRFDRYVESAFFAAKRRVRAWARAAAVGSLGDWVGEVDVAPGSTSASR